eukprot:301131-Chlamydomonas_euryale.AAC.3
MGQRSLPATVLPTRHSHRDFLPRTASTLGAKGKLALEQTCAGANLNWGKLVPGQTCARANLNWGKLALGQTCAGANLLWGKLVLGGDDGGGGASGPAW